MLLLSLSILLKHHRLQLSASSMVMLVVVLVVMMTVRPPMVDSTELTTILGEISQPELFYSNFRE